MCNVIILYLQTCICYSEDNSTSLSDTIKAGAFADPGHKPAVPLLLAEDREVPFSSLLTPTCRTSPPTTPLPSEQDNNNRYVCS
jgi:hypothetical protein